MGGKNPYLEPVTVEKPVQKYQVTFLPAGKVVEVDPAKIPYGNTGLEGSILDIAMANGVDIDHACGGVVACSTCHVYVNQGRSTCNEASEGELDQLDNAPATRFSSRLACQTVPNGRENVTVEIPGWNRNAVREGT